MAGKFKKQMKKEASSHKNWSQARKDTYVYGTLRKLDRKKRWRGKSVARNKRRSR